MLKKIVTIVNILERSRIFLETVCVFIYNDTETFFADTPPQQFPARFIRVPMRKGTNRQMSQSKEQRAQKKALEEKKRKQTKAALIATVAVIAVLVAAVLTINSKAFRRNATAVTIGDTKFSVVDFNYFFYAEYYQYISKVYSEYPGYAESMLPDTSQPLDAQYVSADETWADRIGNAALDTMTDTVAAWNAGHEAGYELSESKAAEVDETYSAAEAQASMNGYSLDAFLSRNYGKGITGKAWKELLLLTAYADEYREKVKNDFSYSQDELDGYYADNASELDVYCLRSFYISGSAFEDGMDGAKAAADAYAASIHAEQDMIDAARDFDAETYADDDSTLHYYEGSSLAGPYHDWVTEDGRQAGDVYVAENESHGAYYVLYYIDRIRNDYPCATVHMISMFADEISSDDYDTTEAYESALAVARSDLKDEAEEVLAEWNKAEDKTEDTFKVLYDDHTENYYYENGLYESYHRHEYTEDMDAWVYDEARQQGDAAIFSESDGDSYYFLVFDGMGESYRDYLAWDGLSSSDYLAWDASVREGLTAEKTIWFSQTV